MDLEIRHFRLVKPIVEKGSIANAADILHLTPSALSHQLREAELQVGTKIFHRINKKLVLTEVGEEVLSSAHTILDEIDNITSDPVDDDKIEYIELFKDEMVALVSESHPWNNKQYVVAEDFNKENLIIHSKPLSTVTVYQRVLNPASVPCQLLCYDHH